MSRNNTEVQLTLSSKSYRKLILSRPTPPRLQKKIEPSVVMEHNNAVNSIEVTGTYLISASSDYFVKKWNVKDWTSHIECKHKHAVVAVKQIDNRVVSCSCRGNIKITNYGLHFSTLHAQKKVTCMEYLKDNRIIVMGHRIDFWDLNTEKLFRDSAEEEGLLNCSAVHTENTFYVGCDNVIKLWDTRTSRFVLKKEVHYDCVTGILADKQDVYTCSLDKSLKLWDLRYDKEVWIRKAPGQMRKIIKCKEFVCSAGAQVIAWDNEIRPMGSGWFKDIAYCDFNRKIYAGESSGKIYSFRAEKNLSRL